MHSWCKEPWLVALCCFLLSSILVAFQTDVMRIPAVLRKTMKTQHVQQPLEHIEIPNKIHQIHNSNNLSSLSNDLNNLHDVKLTSFSESPEIFPKRSPRSTTSTKSLSPTRTPRTTTHPPVVSVSIPGQSELPWTPVSLDAKGIERLELGINFSLTCNASCRVNRSNMCKDDEISRCFGMDCQCSKGFLLPAESKTLPLKGPRFAIVLAGMTRSFFSKLMNEFWRLFLARFNGDLVLFAVLTTISKQKLKATGLSARKDQVWSKFTMKELRKALESLNVTWDAAFVEDVCGWQVARQHVQDPTLRAMLDVKAKFPGEGGQNNLFRSRVIAFDRILRYELQTGQRFRHLLVMRPDFAPYLGHEDPAFVVSSVKGSVYAYNDLINIFERKFATYVFTEPATIRSSFTTLDKDAWQSLLWKLWNRSNTHYTVLLPNAHMALHGVPMCGGSLQAIPDIPCTEGSLEANATLGFIRDRWRVKGPQDVCVDRSRGAPLKFIKDYFRRLGMNQSLVEDLSLCRSK